MRAIALASAFVIVLLMSATPTTQAADRTIQSLDEDRDLATLTAWILDLERAWISVATPGGAGLVAWTSVPVPVPVTVDSELLDRETPESTSNDRKARVILEDGAPF